MRFGNWRITTRPAVWKLSRRYNQIGLGPFVLTHTAAGRRLDGITEPSIGGPVHVVPVNDAAPHEMRALCPCMPTIEIHRSADAHAASEIYVHNAWDGRQ